MPVPAIARRPSLAVAAAVLGLSLGFAGLGSHDALAAGTDDARDRADSSKTVLHDGERRTIADSRTLYDFSTASSTREAWTAVNDGVMGGVSAGLSRLSSDGVLEFIGSVSLDNNGGFASIRSNSNLVDLSSYDGITLRVRGDGKTYTFGITTDVFIPAGAYETKFDTADDGAWQELYFPFEAFEATAFGNRIRGSRPLDPAQIRRFSLLIADKQVGPFRLEVAEMRAVRLGEADPGHNAAAPNSVASGETDAARKASGSSTTTDAMSRAERLDALRDLISLAIERGVPLFNDGDPAACAAVYEVALDAMLMLGGDAFPPAVRDELMRTLANGRAESDATRRAWIFRIGLDRALIETLPRTDRPRTAPTRRDAGADA